jgi:hypothetical protein
MVVTIDLKVDFLFSLLLGCELSNVTMEHLVVNWHSSVWNLNISLPSVSSGDCLCMLHLPAIFDTALWSFILHLHRTLFGNWLDKMHRFFWNSLFFLSSTLNFYISSLSIIWYLSPQFNKTFWYSPSFMVNLKVPLRGKWTVVGLTLLVSFSPFLRLLCPSLSLG